MAMKFINKLKRIGYATSLKEAMRLNEDDCPLNIVYIRIKETVNKSTYEYTMLTKCFNPYRTGYGSDESIKLFSDYGFKSIDIALGEITEQILICKEKHPEMTTIFCYFETSKNYKIFNYSSKLWDLIYWEDFMDKYGY